MLTGRRYQKTSSPLAEGCGRRPFFLDKFEFNYGVSTFKEFGFILQGYYVDPGSSDEPK